MAQSTAVASTECLSQHERAITRMLTVMADFHNLRREVAACKRIAQAEVQLHLRNTLHMTPDQRDQFKLHSRAMVTSLYELPYLGESSMMLQRMLVHFVVDGCSASPEIGDGSFGDENLSNRVYEIYTLNSTGAPEHEPLDLFDMIASMRKIVRMKPEARLTAFLLYKLEKM